MTDSVYGNRCSTDSRLRWRCRRGMRELDVLLLSFLEQGYDGLDGDGREAFQRLLEYPDWDLLRLLMQQAAPDDREVDDVLKAIRTAAASAAS